MQERRGSWPVQLPRRLRGLHSQGRTAIHVPVEQWQEREGPQDHLHLHAAYLQWVRVCVVVVAGQAARRVGPGSHRQCACSIPHWRASLCFEYAASGAIYPGQASAEACLLAKGSGRSCVPFSEDNLQRYSPLGPAILLYFLPKRCPPCADSRELSPSPGTLAQCLPPCALLLPAACTSWLCQQPILLLRSEHSNAELSHCHAGSTTAFAKSCATSKKF